MFLAEMSTVASQVACKHGVDVLKDFVYLAIFSHMHPLRDIQSLPIHLVRYTKSSGFHEHMFSM